MAHCCVLAGPLPSLEMTQSTIYHRTRPTNNEITVLKRKAAADSRGGGGRGKYVLQTKSSPKILLLKHRTCLARVEAS